MPKPAAQPGKEEVPGVASGVSRPKGSVEEFSIVIATYGRGRDLETALSSILEQTVLPKEVIIVDDTPDDSIERVVQKNQEAFHARKVRLSYFRNPRDRGAGISKNVGAEKATGEIVLFMDDDVILDKEYLREVAKVYKTHPWAKGVQGMPIGSFVQAGKPGLLNAFKRMFLLSSMSMKECAVQRSFKSTFPLHVSELSECDWLSGSNQSFRRAVLADFHNDEKMKRYSAGDDVDLSFRVHRSFPHALYITPEARFVHNFAPVARPPSAEMMFVDFVYSYYLFHKNMGRSVLNKLAFAWSWIGRIANWSRVWIGVSLRRASSGDSSLTLRDIVEAQRLCLNHLDEIRSGELRFFDDFLAERLSAR